MTRTDNFIRDRRLSREDVIAINHLLKSRAKRYIAAADKTWLYPEREFNGSWAKIAKVLLPKAELWRFGGEIYVGYKDGTSGYWDEHGRTSKAHEFLTRKRPRKNIGANDFCGCGSAYAFKDCCQRLPAPERPSWEVYGLRERNLMFCDAVKGTVARLGGDEFVVILSERIDGAANLAAAAVQRILDAVAQPLTIEGHKFFPTCSIGVAVYPNDGEDAETLMTHADIAMYRAKELGRNNYQFFAPAMNEKTLERLRIEGELRQALERDEFVLHYQPQVDMCSGHIVGVEALIRWNHPELGMVPPAHFIGLAEATGLIAPIGAWVLRTACAQNKAWSDAGLGRLRISVNLSARQFAHDLASSITSILDQTGLAANDLEIELTESLVMSDVERAIEILRDLKDIGVQLSIDDFGTGYSSLAYLKRFPIDVLKIDRSFMRDITVDPDGAAIVASIISLSHNLKLRVIAEGVETQEQVAYLRLHGCDEMQGYYFSKPVSAEAFEQMLRKGKNLALEFDSAAA